MKYTKYDMGGYFLHTIETDKFKDININLNIKRKSKKDEITIRKVLINTLFDSCKKYPTRKELEIHAEDLYGLAMNIFDLKSGKCNVISLREALLNDKYTGEDTLKQGIELLNEVVFNPNIEDNKFNEKSFQVAKRIVKNDIESIKDNPSFYGNIRLFQEINSKNPISFIANLDDLKDITSESLYKYYLDIINNDQIDIFIIGKIDSLKVKKIFEDNFNISKRDIKKIDHYVFENNIGDGKIIKETLPINQCKLVMGYNFESLTKFENRYVLNLLSFILGGSADSKLFKEVREKESLCYSISSSYNSLAGLITISAGIDTDNFKKTKKLIEKQLKEIKNGNISDEELENGKKIYKNSCLELFDSPSSLIGMYISADYMDADLYEEKIKNIEKVTKENIIALINKMHLNKIFILEGESDEKDSHK